MFSQINDQRYRTNFFKCFKTTCLVDFTTSAAGLNFLTAAILQVYSTPVSVLEHLIFKAIALFTQFNLCTGLNILSVSKTARAFEGTCSAAQLFISIGIALHIKSARQPVFA